ncbi:MAG TPA: class I tRNA ligase family protein [Candidatus Azoamicus sp.]
MIILKIIIKFNVVNKSDFIIKKNMYESLLILLSPITPHITNYIWTFLLKKDRFIFLQTLPIKFSYDCLNEDKFNLIVNINNKFKKVIHLSKNLDDKEIIDKALSDDYIKSLCSSKIKNILYKKFKMINIILV